MKYVEKRGRSEPCAPGKESDCREDARDLSGPHRTAPEAPDLGQDYQATYVATYTPAKEGTTSFETNM